MTSQVEPKLRTVADVFRACVGGNCVYEAKDMTQSFINLNDRSKDLLQIGDSLEFFYDDQTATVTQIGSSGKNIKVTGKYDSYQLYGFLGFNSDAIVLSQCNDDNESKKFDPNTSKDCRISGEKDPKYFYLNRISRIGFKNVRGNRIYLKGNFVSVSLRSNQDRQYQGLVIDSNSEFY